MEYDVINVSTLHGLIENVNAYLKDGWVCVGGICISDRDQYGAEYCQAMIRNR